MEASTKNGDTAWNNKAADVFLGALVRLQGVGTPTRAHYDAINKEGGKGRCSAGYRSSDLVQ